MDTGHGCMCVGMVRYNWIYRSIIVVLPIWLGPICTTLPTRWTVWTVRRNCPASKKNQQIRCTVLRYNVRHYHVIMSGVDK